MIAESLSALKQTRLQPIRRFALDAAILFSDILTVSAAMGLDLQFNDGEGPLFTNPVIPMILQSYIFLIQNKNCIM